MIGSMIGFPSENADWPEYLTNHDACRPAEISTLPRLEHRVQSRIQCDINPLAEAPEVADYGDRGYGHITLLS